MGKSSKTELTLKQRLFVEAYTGEARGNATQAARLAGYRGNDKTLAQVGKENLRKPTIANAIKPRLEDLVGTVVLGRVELQSLWTKWALDESATKNERVRATELLARSQGLFIEKREVTKTGATKPKRKPPTSEELAEKIRRAQRVIDAIKSKEAESGREPEPTQH